MTSSRWLQKSSRRLVRKVSRTSVGAWCWPLTRLSVDIALRPSFCWRANKIGPVVDPARPFDFSGGLPTQAEPGKFRRRNFAHAGPELHKMELAGTHHSIDGRTTDPGGFAKLRNADADACDRRACSRSTPLLPDWGMFDRHWEPSPLSGRLPLFHKISV